VHPRLLAALAALAILLVPFAAAAQVPLPGLDLPPGGDDVVWLCRPGLPDDPCEIPLDTTVREPDGSERVETPERQPVEERPVDCFYVYPTVSNQPTPNASKTRDPELRSIAQYQAARFSAQCRVFAPVYRQATLANLAVSGQVPPANLADRDLAYADVLAAWQDYLANDNDGRGVVLLGHSQGSALLRTLLQREIEPDPEQRRLLVGAQLLGTTVTIAEGRTTGGDFAEVPICTRPDEHGCIVTFASYAEDPPANSRYGRTAEPGLEAACTDPGLLSGLNGPFGITVPSEPFFPGIILLGIMRTNGGLPPSAPTTWVTPPDRFEGGCAVIDGAHVLRYEPIGEARRPSTFPDDSWGTHLIDVNLGLERQVAIAGRQATAWLADQAAEEEPPAEPDEPSSAEPAEGEAQGGPELESPPPAATAAVTLPATGGAVPALGLLALAVGAIARRAARR
jgi:hypothetical protein